MISIVVFIYSYFKHYQIESLTQIERGKFIEYTKLVNPPEDDDEEDEEEK